MAKIVVSDLSREPASRTLSFTFGGAVVELDVTDEEFVVFEKFVTPYVEAAGVVEISDQKETKPTRGKAAAKKATAKRTAAKRTAAKKTTAKKTAARKATAKKTTAKKTAAKKTAAKKTTAKKTAAKKATAKKTTAKRTASRATPTVTLPSGKTVNKSDVTTWAAAHNQKIPVRGPISKVVLEQYEKSL